MLNGITCGCEGKNHISANLLKKSIKIVLGKKIEQHTTKFVIHSKNEHEILRLEFGDYSGNIILLILKCCVFYVKQSKSWKPWKS